MSSTERSISPINRSTATTTAALQEPIEGAKTLQGKLHILLNKLAKSMRTIDEWPDEDGDDSTNHAETTSQLTSDVLDVVDALKDVEGVIKADATLRKALQDCQVPVNLLDLLDHGQGLNPDCFSRGLLREASGQLAGLNRRKIALVTLGAAVQKGLDMKDEQQRQKQNEQLQQQESSSLQTTKSSVETTAGAATETAASASKESSLQKRKADQVDASVGGVGADDDKVDDSTKEPPSKKAKA